MMATPQDLRDFAVGFSLSEGIVLSADDIETFEIVELDDGIGAADMAGAIQSGSAQRAAAAYRRPYRLPDYAGSIQSLKPFAPQLLSRRADHSRRETLWRRCKASRRCKRSISRRARYTPRRSGRPARGIVALREDVGRHNALDKLAGALAQDKTSASEGIVLLTSRVSVEMVQKTAAMGAPVMVAVSAPTALAVRMADAAGITLAAIARADGFEIFTHPERINFGVAADGVVHVA